MKDLNQYATLHELLEHHLSAARFSELKHYYEVTTRMCTIRLVNPNNMDYNMVYKTVDLLYELWKDTQLITEILATYQIGWDGMKHRAYLDIEERINWLAQTSPTIHFRTEKVA